jgi:hypothetical protein
MRAANCEPRPRQLPLLGLGLNEMPSRMAFLIASGERPVAFAASSSDFEERASSIMNVLNVVS